MDLSLNRIRNTVHLWPFPSLTRPVHNFVDRDLSNIFHALKSEAYIGLTIGIYFLSILKCFDMSTAFVIFKPNISPSHLKFL